MSLPNLKSLSTIKEKSAFGLESTFGGILTMAGKTNSQEILVNKELTFFSNQQIWDSYGSGCSYLNRCIYIYWNSSR